MRTSTMKTFSVLPVIPHIVENAALANSLTLSQASPRTNKVM